MRNSKNTGQTKVLSHTSASFLLWRCGVSMEFNQNKWEVTCSWSSNQRIKRTTVLTHCYWTVNECTSSLLYGNPDEMRGEGDNKNNNQKNKTKTKEKSKLRRAIFLFWSRAWWMSPVWQRCLQCDGPSMEQQVPKDMLMLVCECACVCMFVFRYRIVQRLCVFFLLFLLLRLVSLYLLISRTSE